MSEPQRSPHSAHYEAWVATWIGVCALAVSGYTAYVQRQQVRAVVWPILEYSTSNEPFLRLSLANKGVGPALIRRVVLKVDGRPVANWQDALQKLFGGRHYRFSFSTLNSRVLSAGESIDILVPRDAEDRPLTATSESNSLGFQMNQERGRVSVEVCYASTLGDCWVLRSGGEEAGGAAAISTTTETHDCPKSLAGTFQQ